MTFRSLHFRRFTGGGRYVTGAVFVLVLVLYVVSMPVEYTIGDAFEEVRNALTCANFSRSNHLLTTGVNWLYLHAMLLLFPMGRHFILLQTLMVLSTLIAGYGILTLSRSVTRKRSAAVLVTTFFFLSAAVLLHGRTAETGMLPLLFFIWSLHFFLRNEGGQFSQRNVIVGAVLYSISVLFALNHIVFLPVLFVIILTGNTAAARGAFVRLFVCMTLFLGIPFLLAAFFSVHVASMHDLVTWLTFHESEKYMSHLHVNASSLLRSLSGFMNTYTDSAGATTWVRLFLSGRIPFPADPAVHARLVLMIVVLGLIAASIVQTVRHHRRMGFIILTAFVCNFGFTLFWLGSDPQFWLPLLPFVAISLSLSIRDQRKHKRGLSVVSIVLFALMIVCNVPMNEPSFLFPQGGKQHQAALQVRHLFRTGDIVFTPGGLGWSTSLSQIEPGIRVEAINDYSGIGERKKTKFLQDFDRAVQQEFAGKHRVFIDGLYGELTSNLVGPWDIFVGFRGMTREDFRKELEARYVVEVRASSGIVNITEIVGLRR